MSSKSAEHEWQFSFGLEQDGPGLVTIEQANEFMEAIIALAETRGFVVGGGYSAYPEPGTKSHASEA